MPVFVFSLLMLAYSAWGTAFVAPRVPILALALMGVNASLAYTAWAFRPRKTENTPDSAFLATFATPPARVQPQYVTPLALLVACEEAVAHAEGRKSAAQVLVQADADLAHLSAKIEHFAATVEAFANGQAYVPAQPTSLDEVEDALARLAAEIEADNARAVAHAVESVRVQHFASSTERMRAQRAAYAAQGLTARGTKPQPMCEGVTKAGKPCKRRAQVGTTTCSLDHATTEEALALWIG